MLPPFQSLMFLWNQSCSDKALRWQNQTSHIQPHSHNTHSLYSLKIVSSKGNMPIAIATSQQVVLRIFSLNLKQSVLVDGINSNTWNAMEIMKFWNIYTSFSMEIFHTPRIGVVLRLDHHSIREESDHNKWQENWMLHFDTMPKELLLEKSSQGFIK